MNHEFVLVRKDNSQRFYCAWPIRSDFQIARYPVTVTEFEEVVEARSTAAPNSTTIKTATWAEALRYCNLLNRKSGLPPAYDEGTGMLIDEDGKTLEDVLEVHGFRAPTARVKGYRLPTLAEWEWAAMGFGNPQGGYYLDILAKTCTIPGLEPGIPQVTNGLEELELNPTGIYGMLGNAVEWCSDNQIHDAATNKVCCWRDYYVNYDRISYCVQPRICSNTDRHRFRVVLTQGDSSK